MLEGLVAGLLNRFLGMYVKNFDPTQLKVGIWSGDVKLRNLELRREALDQLKLPINVVEGHLGELTLVIPWSNLRGAPVKILVEDVFLLASPKEEAAYDEDEEERRRQRIKMEKLDSAELLKERSKEGLSQEEQKRSQSFTESLVTKIVDNLQVTVKNIHVRYEDSISTEGHPFALGLTLEEFSAVSTDGGWKPAFIQSSAGVTHKLATLGALAVYWNTDTELLGTGRETAAERDPALPRSDMMERFKAMIGNADAPSSPDHHHQFILRPVSGQAKIELDKTGDRRRPKFKASLMFEEIGLVLDDDQYRDALMMVDLFHYFIRHQEYKKLQPKGVSPKEDPRAWFKFAGDAILSKIHERNRRWSWDYIRERRDDRHRYVELFKKKRQGQALAASENDDLGRLERKLSYEDLRFWRSLARNQLGKENAEALRHQPKKQQQPQQQNQQQNQQQQQGWLSWMWGAKPQGQASTDDDENTQMTEEQRKELYDAIEWDEKAAVADAVDVPKDSVQLQLEASLGTGSFTLKKGPHAEARDLLSLHFDLLKSGVLTRTDSFLANLTLGGFRVNDGTTPDSLYPEIVRVKDAPEAVRQHRMSLAELERSDAEPFFEFELEQNPIDRPGDIALVGKLKPLEIIWNPNFAVGIVEFFRPPERHMESITALMETAGASIEGLTEQTRAGLEFALEEHKTINAQLDLQAPLIIVPASITSRDSTCLIVDAGHIAVSSELVDQDTLKQIQSKQRQSYTEEDFRRLESVMYDKFLVKLASTQVLIGPSIDATKSQLAVAEQSPDKPLHVVEGINVDFVVEVSIIPKAPKLPKLKVSGHLPMLHAMISDWKYKNLMRIIDVAVPKLGGEPGQGEGGGEPNVKKRLSRPRLLSSSASSRSRRSQMRDRRPSGAQFPFLTPHTAVIFNDDNDENDDNDDDGDGNGDSFEDATDGTEKTALKIRQRSFQLQFKVDTLKGSLYRSDPDRRRPDQLLVELVAHEFKLELYTRPYDMAAEVSLGSVTVDDFVDNPPAEFKSIVSSGDSEDREQNRSLVHVRFVKVNRQSPEFMPVYEGVETNVTAEISTVNLVVTRKTLLTLLDFILVTFTNTNGPNDGQNQAAREAEGGSPRLSIENASADTDRDADRDEAIVPLVQPPPPENSSGSIRVKVDLKTIRLILNNDGIRLATLSFNHADVGIFLHGKTMRVSARLGDLSLVDDVNQGVQPDSALRRLVTIQGDGLADLRYETFGRDSAAYPGYDASVYLRAGSVKVNFLEEPFRKIVGFLVKFGKMQAIFNAARQAAASQASQMQQSDSRYKFDVVVNTPIVVFPRVVEWSGRGGGGGTKRDLVTAYLGEIYAQNKFAPLSDAADAVTGMKVAAGIRNIRLTSDFHHAGDASEELEIIDHVDLGFNVTYAEHRAGAQRPDLEIEGTMSDINLRLTQHQLRFLMDISRSVPAAFVSEETDEEADAQAEQEVDEGTLRRAETARSTRSGDSGQSTDLGPELGGLGSKWTKLDFAFQVSTVGLELVLAPEDRPVGDVVSASLSRFSLDKIKLKTRILSDSSLEAELLIRSFNIHDSRPGDTNKFRRIMESSGKDVQQLMASVTATGGGGSEGDKARTVIAMCTVDSPRVIFALDYLFALQKFVAEGLKVEEAPVPIGDDESIASMSETPDGSDVESTRALLSGPADQTVKAGRQGGGLNEEVATDEKSTAAQPPGINLAVKVSVVYAQVILIANPLSASSEAIVLGMEQVLLSRHHALTFQLSQAGMFLCRMDRFEDSRLRIIDDFSIQMSMDSSRPDLTSMHVDVEPLILRLSLRDILLALQIIGRASELSGSDDDDKKRKKASPAADMKARELREAGLKQRTASGRGPSTMAAGGTTIRSRPATTADGKKKQASKGPVVVRRSEEMTATIDGIRVVLIGDLHELPIVDLGIKNFTATAADWSSNLKAEAAIDMYTNVYNFSKSSWEPLLEPWQFGVGVAKEQESGMLSVEVASKKTFDVTVTTATIALAYKSLAFLTQDQDVLGKPRGVEAPYRLRNRTGFEAFIEARSPSSNEPITARLEDGADVAWSFEHWEKMRENLLVDNQQNSVSVRLEGSGFDPVRNVRLNREGEFLYGLQPRTEDDVLHRICVEVTLGKDNVKLVTLRSPLLVENATEIPVELGVFDPVRGELLKIEKVAPGDARSAPVGAAFQKALLVRPDSGFGFGWSEGQLEWRDLLKSPTRTAVCKPEAAGGGGGNAGGNANADPFYFQVHARYDKANPITKTYPYMRIKLSAPVTLENLLPYDFKYRIYDKDPKRQSKDWANFLRKGGVSPVHVVRPSSLLLLSVEMQDTVFKASDFAVINGGDAEDFRKEHKLACKDEQGQALNLKLHYHKIPDGGGAFKVAVYSPYVVLNKTGLDVSIRTKQFLQGAKAAAGQFPLVDTSTDREQPKALPFMFSFGSDDHRNRALLRVADSEWSRPQSFDAIGSTSEVVLACPGKGAEIHAGITVESGDGKYKMTKVVTLAPRFVVQNMAGEELLVRETSAAGFMTLAPGSLQALHRLRKGAEKQLSLCLPGADNNQWTSPFSISDVGTAHVKISRAGQRQRLVRVEVLLEAGTLFVHLSFEPGNWPFSMRNESDMEFTFHQSNPHADEDGVEDQPSGWKPVRYRLPPRSIMPYAWDYPAARFKEVILSGHGKERHIKLAEIGNQVPMKFVTPSGHPKIIDISVAAQGPTQSLILSNFRPSKSLYRQKSRQQQSQHQQQARGGGGSASSTTGVFEPKQRRDSGIKFRAQLQLSGIGVSLINSQLKELAYVTFRDVALRYSESALHQTVSLAIKWIQIDNQLYGGIFPMVLYPSVVPKRANEVEAHPSLHAMVTRVKDDSYGVLYVKYATVLLQQMTVELDEDFVFAVLDFSKIPGLSPDDDDNNGGGDGGHLCEEELGIPQPKGTQGPQRDIYFELLNIQPMQLDLSFMRTERVNAEDKTSSKNPIMFFLNVMTMAIGNVNDAPVRFNALMLENVRVSPAVLARNVSNHYSQEVLYQVHKILGSADVLGNPVGLFNNISSGVTDIFYEPYQGLILSDRPEEFGLGIAKGAASFVKKSVYGVSDSFSKFTGSLSKGLAAATMDKQFQDRRRISRARNRPRHALYGVAAGANSFFTSVASGVGGLTSKPFEGAEQEGPLGFFKGVGKGVLGLATKPVIGVLDMASNVSEGIRNTTTVFDGTELDRVRLARFVPADGVVRPYNAREALGQFWLKQVDTGRYFDEQYVAHLELPREDMVAMVTFARVLMIRSRRLTTEWDVPLREVQTVAKERTGLSIVLRGGGSGPFVPIADEGTRGWFYGMVGVAVGEFNSRYRGVGG